MAPVAGLEYLVGPVVVFAVLAGLALFLRWAFGSDDRGRPPSDDGLLTRVATMSSREAALALRAVLSDADIRSTIRFPGPHRAEVLVFPEDAERARRLASSFPAG
ncbi:hypothetical protein ACI78V_17810 [Geodermatophilus sp. SYSU D00742]